MDEKSNIAPVQESQVEQPKQETVEEVLTVDKKPEQKNEETVPLSALLEAKKVSKELAKTVKALEKRIEEGASKEEVSETFDDITEEFPDVDPKFLKKMEARFLASAKKQAEAEVSEKLKPLQEKEKAEKIDKAFNAHFDKTLAAMPEYKDIVNKDVIKALSLSPASANKTFTQLIEESYGHLIEGKRSIDSGSTRVSKNDDTEIDLARAKKDPAYFKEIMDNPALKQKYNKEMVSRVASQI